MPRFKQNRPGINSPNQKQGSIETFERGKGWTTKNGTTGQVPQVQSDGTIDFATLTLNYVASHKTTAFTGNGTFTPDANCLFAWVRGVGGGGGGGGTDPDTGATAGGGGGGAGGYCEEWFTAAQLGASVTVTIGGGGGGGGGNGSGGTGTSGGNTTFGALFTAGGGTGGSGTGSPAASTVTAPGGAGGTASGGTTNAPGAPGTFGFSGCSGCGGSSPFGGGGLGTNIDQLGNNGTGFGSGGGGAWDDDTTGRAGGSGADGYVIVVEFLKA